MSKTILYLTDLLHILPFLFDVLKDPYSRSLHDSYVIVLYHLDMDIPFQIYSWITLMLIEHEYFAFDKCRGGLFYLVSW